MTNVAIFVSGEGTNCENIIRYFQGSEEINIVMVLSSSPSAHANERARRLGVPVAVVSKEAFEDPGQMIPMFEGYGVDFIVLAGFLRIIPEWMTKMFNHRMINIHPSLLPKFGGKGMFGRHVHEAVKAAGEKETGMTVHWVTGDVDGGEIIAQFSTPLSPSDSVDELAAKEHRLEMEHFPRVIAQTIAGFHPSGVKALAIDADDTLWENETYFREAEKDWAALLKDYGSLEELSSRLYEVEAGNMAEFGYGVKAFTLSLIETALKVSGDKLSGNVTASILNIGRKILSNPAKPFEGVRDTLLELRKRYRLIMFTKGDLLDQGEKAGRSGLRELFDEVVIVAGKGEKEYLRLCSRLGVKPSELMGIGNSFKSDVAPVVTLGGFGVHIPFHILWEHEKTEEFDSPRILRLGSFSELKYFL